MNWKLGRSRFGRGASNSLNKLCVGGEGARERRCGSALVRSGVVRAEALQ